MTPLADRKSNTIDLVWWRYSALRHKLARKKASDREMEILKQAAWTVQLQYDRKQREKARQAAQQEAKRQKHVCK